MKTYKSNLPPDALPYGVRIKGTDIATTEENVVLALEQMTLIMIEFGITGKLKEQMHEAGVLPLKEKDLKTTAYDMAKFIAECIRNGSDLEAAFLEAGILPQIQKLSAEQLRP